MQNDECEVQKEGLTAEEIAGSLRICANPVPCEGCIGIENRGDCDCADWLKRTAADMIEELAKEVARLQGELILKNAELLKLREENRWISVEEGMPEAGRLVQTISDEGVREGCFLDVNGWWRLSIGISTKLVTHWRPVPKRAEG